MSGRGVKDFLGKAAPPGYVAGLGRGATGFVTRPDYGPGASIAVAPVAPTEEDRFEDADNEEGLLAHTGPLGADDEEADLVFAEIEAKMRERRSSKKTITTEPSNPQNDPSVLFASEKLKLRQVTADEWANLPESGDFIAKRAKKTNERERYTPVPDSVLVGSTMKVIDEDTDFRTVGEARERVLAGRLDMAEGTNQGGVDPLDYLSHLEEQSANNAQVNDIRRARTLLRSAVNTNPTNPSAWLAAARIEEISGNSKQARAVLAEALEACPGSEDLWASAIRTAPPGEASVILQRAIERLPRSPQIWLQAAEMEKDLTQSKKVLRRALENNVESVDLWKALVEKEEDAEDARVLLAKAVEYCPTSPELWIALARLESHENARRILNKARKLNPMNTSIWLAAARLEEAHGNEGGIVEQIINRAVSELGECSSRENWIKEAVDCEKADDLACAEAIIRTTAKMGFKEGDDLCSIWILNSDNAKAQGAMHVARSLIRLSIELDQGREDAWIRLFGLEENEDSMRAAYEGAVQACPHSSKLWLSYAKYTGEGSIFKRAIAANPTTDELWLEAAKNEIDCGSIEEAHQILTAAVSSLKSDRIWKKLAKLELQMGRADMATQTLRRGLEGFPRSELLWHLLGLINPDEWEGALLACPKSVPILEEASIHLAKSQPMRARAILEKARQSLSDSPQLWLASIRLELSLNATMQARSLMTRALQKCPDESILWYMAISMEARALRKAKTTEALRRCGNDALIYLAIAQLLELERNLTTAQEYYERACEANPDIGDVWAYYLIFVKRHHPDDVVTFMERALRAEPRDGPQWKSFRKELRWWRHPFAVIFKEFVNRLDE